MKRFICVILVLLIGIGMMGCSKEEQKTAPYSSSITTAPLREINIIYDSYGNILQQIVYNELTEEYTTTTFTYVNKDGQWLCVDQRVIITRTKEVTPTTTNERITVYRQQDLSTGEIVLLDNTDVRVSVVEYLDKASWWEFGYKVKIENKSDRVLSIMFDNVAIVGIACKPVFFVEHVESGRTEFFTLAWDKDTLDSSWIPYINDIEFVVKVFRTDSYNGTALYGTRVLIKK